MRARDLIAILEQAPDAYVVISDREGDYLHITSVERIDTDPKYNKEDGDGMTFEHKNGDKTFYLKD